MSTQARLDSVQDKSGTIYFYDSSRFVIFSDCHRGDGSKADDFLKNKDTFNTALDYYYKNGFVYMEAGDGDELWENRHFSTIYATHRETFRRLERFHKSGRLYFIYGNHNMPRLYARFLKERNIKLHEGVILKHIPGGKRIFIVHGHQGDLMNDRLWFIARFMVRYILRPLQIYGIRNPISPAINYRRKTIMEIRMKRWAELRGIPLIAGHTHRPCVPESSRVPYYNCGSCVDHGGITCIEILGKTIRLVKWHDGTNERSVLSVTDLSGNIQSLQPR
jgi:UDP-2,3-diacylglucosamine pyrophosphatase LpxH